MFEISHVSPIIVMFLTFGVFLGIYLLLFLFSYRFQKQTYTKLIKNILLSTFILAGLASLGFGIFVQPKLVVTEQEGVTLPDLAEIAMTATEDTSEIPFPKAYLKGEWEIMTEALHVDVVGEWEVMPFVVVDQRLAAGEQGKVSLYETPTLVNGMGIPDDISMLTVQMNGDELFVYPSSSNEEQEVEYQAYLALLPMQQFRQAHYDSELEIAYKEQVLYIQIPPEVSVTASDETPIYYR